MKKTLLINLIMTSTIYAQSPSSVIIDGVEYAPVIKTESETNAQETYTIPENSLQGMEDCWYEEVVITEPSENTINPIGAVAGGILGGVAGHQFGSGRGNTATTIGGAALGTILGSKANTSKPIQRVKTVRKCNIAK